MKWECGIPGKAGTLWENGLYKLVLSFPDNYPAKPPKCIHFVQFLGVFTPPLPHPNIFPSGAVCLSIISQDWKPSITIKQVLIGIQDLLSHPNPKSPANGEYLNLMNNDAELYENVVRRFAAAHANKYAE